MSLDPAKLNSLKVTELKKELKDRGISLPASAKKSDLIAKLAEVLGIDSSITNSAADLNDSISELTASAVTPAVPGEAVATTPATAPAPVLVTAPVPSLTAAVTVDAASNGSASDSVATSNATEAPKVVQVTSADPKDRLAARAARFGASVASVPTPAVSVGSSETIAALKKRTERFGEVVSSTVKSLEEKEKLSQRANRFNVPLEEQNPTTTLGLVRKVKSSPAVESAKRPIVAASTPEEEERLRKRRERFGLT